ncbi:Sensor protein FixL [compost metagenome]|uniref:histidine kinase n=1 Tax=Pseudomonas wadenswilerensis TaxID=1785161 RepID=A0A380T1X0_9PSED|nr:MULTISPECIES: PAS domain S-box protein [Pseudomonas]MCE5985095.1 PAS domain S-box protein [Pseudomonas sp. LF19]UVM23705.1 PAS domain S-box protein [Pseudomonas wadenswilerensis]SUQ64239.1 Sensor protein FixL [Pseudomonas wadenswilerensis]
MDTSFTLLLAKDPQPSLLLDASASVLASNPALQALLGPWPQRDVEHWLPSNYRALVRACLEQGRAINEVEAPVAGQILLWTFIPDDAAQQVLARCRDATLERQGERDASQARRLYRLITENTTDLISRHTPDGSFIDASPAAFRLLGYWPEELRGVQVQSLFHPQDRQQSLLQASQALEQDGYQTMTCRVRHRDGRYLWFEIASRAIRETYTGAVVEIVSVSRDISVRIEAQENRRRLAEVVEANTDLVLFSDRDGRLSYLNRSARRTLGLQGVEPLPGLHALLDPQLQQRLHSEGWQRAEQHGVWQAEARLIPHQGGAAFPVSLVLLAHRATGGERYYSLVARDMTERELRESQQRRHQDELAHSARLITLGELASGIAHEINQPLAAVVNYASASQRYLQAVERDPQAAQRVAQGLQRINEQATHAAEVIKRLRAFLRKEPRRLQALAIADVVAEAVRLCDWEASRDQVSIEQRVDEGLPPVYADRVLLEQVLLNLLRNAIDANRDQHDGQASRILLSAELAAGWLTIRVSDQGPGVAAERLDGIFTPFNTSKPDGLGLGLSMSRSIVEGFGGTLQAQPGEAGGLILCCRLAPVANSGE